MPYPCAFGAWRLCVKCLSTNLPLSLRRRGTLQAIDDAANAISDAPMALSTRILPISFSSISKRNFSNARRNDPKAQGIKFFFPSLEYWMRLPCEIALNLLTIKIEKDSIPSFGLSATASAGFLERPSLFLYLQVA